MDRRIEPRFTISSPIKVTLLSSLDRQIDCRMIDISAAGMRFVSDQPLSDDEVVAVDFDDHLAVTRVRNCLPYGDKYSIGTSRIHSLPKDQLPPGEPQWQHIRILLEEKGWSVDLGLEDGTEYPTESEPAAAPESSGTAEPTPAEPTPAVSEHAALQAPSVPAAAVALAEAEPAMELKTEPAVMESPAIVAAEPAPVVMPEPVAAPVAPPAPPVPFNAARPQLNLPPITPRQPEKSKRGMVLVSGGIALAILGAMYILQSRHSAQAVHPLVVNAPVTAEPSEKATPRVEAPVEAGPAPSATPEPTAKAPAVAVSPAPAAKATPPPIPKTNPAPASAKSTAPPAAVTSSAAAVTPAANGPTHTVKLTMLQPGWVTATADGKPVFAKVLEKGTQDFPFTQFAFVHLGNSHNAEISLDGTVVPPAPGGGALRLVQLTASGARNIPWSNGDPAAPR